MSFSSVFQALRECAYKDPDKEKLIDEILYEITLCEESYPSHVLIISLEKREGVLLRVEEGSQGLHVRNAQKVFIKLSDEPWETITDVTKKCRELRILKQGELILFICTDTESIEDYRDYICKLIAASDKVATYCLYEWGELE